MGARTAAGTSLVEVSGIGVDCKDHISRTVGDSAVGVRGEIVKELVDSVSDGLGGRGFLGASRAESNDNLVVVCASVPQEVTNDNLDVFDAFRVE